jgi:hypothetical protein
MSKQAKTKLIKGVMDKALVLYLRGLLAAEEMAQVLKKKAKRFLEDKGT